MDIAAWLRGLGLEQYEPAFHANEIDEEVLPSLTSEDLREIGVVLIGHRRRLLNAIAALGTEAPVITGSRAASLCTWPLVSRLFIGPWLNGSRSRSLGGRGAGDVDQILLDRSANVLAAAEP